MKRNPRRTLLAWLLTAAMLASLLPSAAFAASGEAAEEESAAAEQTEALTSETVSDEGYQLAEDSETASGQCGDNAYWSYDASTGTLTISGTGDMYDYSYSNIGSRPWEDYIDEITSVVIEDGVTSIGNLAFTMFSALTSVSIGNDVTTIGEWAFEGCESLTSVTIPGNVTTISTGAFHVCQALTSVTLNEGLVTIGDWAFNTCSDLAGIVIPDSVTTIGDQAFYWTTLSDGVTIGSGVTSIGEEAFGHAFGLTEVWFTGDAPTIGTDAFLAYTTALLSGNEITAYYPAGNATWTEDVMQDYGAESITWVSYEITSVTSGQCGDNAYWSYDSSTGTLTITGTGDMYDYECGETPWFSYYDAITSVVIEDGITSIGDYAFAPLNALTSVSIGSDVTTIGVYAFQECESLTSVTIPGNVKTISKGTFDCCYNLAEITIEEGVVTIGEAAFRENYAVTSLVIPDSVTTIGDRAFYYNCYLENITIGSGVTSIGSAAFAMNYELESKITFTGNAPAFADDAFLHFNATVYYPEDNDTWTEDVMQDYGGTITWVAYSEEPAASFLFSDVTSEGSWYYNAVYWAYDLGITAGYDDGTFLPNKNCTRAEFATFLYALASAYSLENAGDTESRSFTDVTETGWYYTYVMWAAENGLVSGYSDGTFKPNKEITRAEAVTMLYGFYKTFVNGGQEPTVTDEESTFSDLSDTAWYYTYMLWATQNDVVSGYPDGTCRPNTSCTRSVMVVLLHATANNLL